MEPMDLQAPASFAGFFNRLLALDFMPHGHCYFWRPEILWLHVLSDIGIATAYYMIPLSLFYFAIRRKDAPFHRVFYLFAAFIFLCGTTHAMEALTQWFPFYRIEGLVKLATASVSLATAAILIPVIPKALDAPSYAAMNQELIDKADDLSQRNEELRKFSRAAVGREERIIELKKEVNRLSQELGHTPPYDLYFERGQEKEK